MKIFVIGGGFAGIKAAKELVKGLSNEHEVYLIDKNDYTTMLPNLPEIVSGRLVKEDITENILNLVPREVNFLKEEVTDVNFDERKITTKGNIYNYDYLIFGLGSTTNLCGFNQNLDKVNLLDSFEAAKKVRENFIKHMEGREEINLVVSGAGFTGIELACNLYDLAIKNNKKINVSLVDLTKKVLPMLSEKSANHVVDRLNKMKFKIYTENLVATFDGENITLKNGEEIKDVFFCWCSGVKAPLKAVGDYEALPDGRIIVNQFLNIDKYEEVFAAGDAAAIKGDNGSILRRAVTFSEMSGKHAGKNLVDVINGLEKRRFKPIDLGWIIPMYITSVGVAMGVEVRGRKGIFMHYFICGMKNYSFKNFMKELVAAIKYPFTQLK
ncbi:FAD-dependent oxidoreductase [Clostridium sp. YIM B02555]|uniref:NAD(P)/FAD-dependent oxidoreductase n=1 Tax=Clostridium sp. YIM B02555 TaxID=2911968 RepID=UPI001EED2188|nr:FAD-dependent oxidoreductase [Clostridium sp. YIM B02555]